MTGYAHADYAAALAELGRPRRLPLCSGWALERPIPGHDVRDATGCYPLFTCADWLALPDDLREMGGAWVSLVLVSDPFGAVSPASLSATFNAGVTAFKDHVIVQLGPGWEERVSRHHRRNARKALQRLDVQRLADPRSRLDTWCHLYDNLVRRHAVRGPAVFSHASFARQFAVPGLVAFEARADGESVGMVLFFVQGDVAYYHLGAFSDAGYALGASFALFWTALTVFAGGPRWLDLGAEAGLTRDTTSGLQRFKRGWATEIRPTYLCRHIGTPALYAELSRNSSGSDYFPAYRSPRPRAEVACA